MTGTLRMFADLIGSGGWTRPVISPRSADALGPNHDVRAMLVPLGPVAVFGSSNFPLAYGVCGGDTASAIAAGCPVVVKEHPAHPDTGRLIAQAASAAVADAGAPAGTLGYVENLDPRDFAPAKCLVTDPTIRAVGFTGSVRGGVAIDHLARDRDVPIPVFAEMGSVNPVIITAAAAAKRGPAIAAELAASILQRFGQQCTCPGLIMLLDSDSGAHRSLVGELCAALDAAPARDMLAPWIRDGYTDRLSACCDVAGVRLAAGQSAPLGPRAARACALGVKYLPFAEHRTLRAEIFGPATMIVEAPAEVSRRPGRWPLPASLTLSVYFDPDDAADVDRARAVAEAHASIAGRMIFNGVPTGVRVAAAMVHGGPFPATNRPDTTAVGPRAIERWCRPVCWQNAPAELLPGALR